MRIRTLLTAAATGALLTSAAFAESTYSLTVPMPVDSMQVDLGACAFEVAPRTVTSNEDGSTTTDERLTVSLTCFDATPLVCTLDNKDALKLASELENAIESRIEKGLDEKAENLPLSCQAFLGDYAVSQGGMLDLPETIRFRAMNMYIGKDEVGNRFFDKRVTLMLDDAGKRFWPCVVRMDINTARALLTDLEKNIPLAADAQASASTTD